MHGKLWLWKSLLYLLAKMMMHSQLRYVEIKVIILGLADVAHLSGTFSNKIKHLFFPVITFCQGLGVGVLGEWQHNMQCNDWTVGSSSIFVICSTNVGRVSLPVSYVGMSTTPVTVL